MYLYYVLYLHIYIYIYIYVVFMYLNMVSFPLDFELKKAPYPSLFILPDLSSCLLLHNSYHSVYCKNLF